MNFSYNILAYNHSSDEIRLAIPQVMESWGYKLAPARIANQVKNLSDHLIPTLDKELMLRQFLISPTKNNWSIIYQTLWFSEAQQFGLELSDVLDGIILVVLMDDSYGWGYELSKGGELLDKFHTTPNSPTLRDQEGEFGFEVLFGNNKVKNAPINPGVPIDITTLSRLMLPSREQMIKKMAEIKERTLKRFREDMGLSPAQIAEFESRVEKGVEANFEETLAALPTEEERSKLINELPDPTILERLKEMGAASPEQLAEYQGNPFIFAKFLGIPEDKVAERLERSRKSSSIFAHDEMVDLLEKDLKIEQKWHTNYANIFYDLDDLKDWHQLIFSKRMTDIELQWCQMEISQNIMPYNGPPIWINQ